MTVINFPPTADDGPKSIIGPALAGHHVIVEGRIIPHLIAHPSGDQVTLVLDGRFSIVVRSDDAYQVAWLIAQALAIGEGYSHILADAPGRPFAPRMLVGTIEGDGT